MHPPIPKQILLYNTWMQKVAQNHATLFEKNFPPNCSSKGSTTGRAPAVALPVAAAIHEPLPSRPVHSPGLPCINGALRRGRRVAFAVITIRIRNVLLSEILHRRALLGRDCDGVVAVGVVPVAGGEVVCGVHSAAVEDEIGKFCDERGIFVIHLVTATQGGPIWPIPYGCIEGHGLWREVPSHGWGPHHLSYGNVVNIEAAYWVIEQEKYISHIMIVILVINSVWCISYIFHISCL